jgi:AAA domain
MSSTRTASEDSPFRQERFASAPEFERALMANLVAKRCALLEKPADRRLIWFLQLLSNQPGGLAKLAKELMAKFRKRIGNPIEIYGANDPRGVVEKRIEKDVMELALDPAQPFTDGTHAYFGSFVSTLREYQAQWIAGQQPEVVTSIGEIVCSALEYAVARRKLVIIDGIPRIGKSHAAKAWCKLNPGNVRYVELTASNDDISFFREIAICLGVSVNLNSKAHELRSRIEETLRGRDLALVIDEAHYLWPQRHYRNTTPSRINWIMTALVNRGIAVGLITTPQFFRSLSAIELATHWTSDQFRGRVGRYVELPKVLSRDELEDVAANLLPAGNADSIRAVACYAESSGKYLGALDAIADTAKYFCESDGRQKVEFKDVARAIRESVTPSDEALKAAMAGGIKTKQRRVSNVVAAPLQSDFGRAAMMENVSPSAARQVKPESTELLLQ